MTYTVPLRITVEVDSEANVIAAARAEVQRKFHMSDEDSLSRGRPYVDEHLGHALGVMMTSDAVTGALTGILEHTVAGLSVTGLYVATSEVVDHRRK